MEWSLSRLIAELESEREERYFPPFPTALTVSLKMVSGLSPPLVSETWRVGTPSCVTMWAMFLVAALAWWELREEPCRAGPGGGGCCRDAEGCDGVRMTNAREFSRPPCASSLFSGGSSRYSICTLPPCPNPGLVPSCSSEIHLTWRSASEVSMTWQVKSVPSLPFSLTASDISSEWEGMPDPWACGDRDPRREQKGAMAFSSICSGAFDHRFTVRRAMLFPCTGAGPEGVLLVCQLRLICVMSPSLTVSSQFIREE